MSRFDHSQSVSELGSFLSSGFWQHSNHSILTASHSVSLSSILSLAASQGVNGNIKHHDVVTQIKLISDLNYTKKEKKKTTQGDKTSSRGLLVVTDIIFQTYQNHSIKTSKGQSTIKRRWKALFKFTFHIRDIKSLLYKCHSSSLL